MTFKQRKHYIHGVEKDFTSEQLEAALFAAKDFLDEAVCEFFVMGETAKCMKEDRWLTGKKIDIGIKEKEYIGTKEIMLIANPNIDIQPRKIIMIHEEVPIEIRIIHKHYRVLDHLDQILYAYEDFLVPNPFDAFIRMSVFMH